MFNSLGMHERIFGFTAIDFLVKILKIIIVLKILKLIIVLKILKIIIVLKILKFIIVLSTKCQQFSC